MGESCGQRDLDDGPETAKFLASNTVLVSRSENQRPYVSAEHFMSKIVW